MTVRRLVSALSVGLLVATAAPASLVSAQPKKTAGKKKTPAAAPATAAPAPAPTPTTAPAASGSTGTAVQMTEDPPPPKDINGTAENPNAPKLAADPDAPPPPEAPPPKVVRTGYPTEEVLRPITLPKNLSEVSIDPHAQVSPYAGSAALRARYGITSKLQLRLTYMLAGIFDDPATVEHKQGIHAGKAIGLDVTYLIQDWVGVSVGLPIYINPFALSLTIGAPIKFTFADKFAIGGLDDLLNIKLDTFAPTFYQEVQNATNANTNVTNTVQSAGELRVSAFGEYQYQPDLAIIARIGVQLEDFATGKTNGCAGECETTFLHVGFQYSPRNYLDLGLSIGFDDLAHGGSFAPSGFLAFRI
ncbi:MAG TPA: hypothetical protein VFP84_11110 [Kofleriaceae bacterium]|nr:hypothetical protein [Kofleriaceae bacterium]